jgi:hypothetical protein
MVPLERRSVFAAVADRLVPADQPRDLWRHWGTADRVVPGGAPHIPRPPPRPAPRFRESTQRGLGRLKFHSSPAAART